MPSSGGRGSASARGGAGGFSVVGAGDSSVVTVRLSAGRPDDGAAPTHDSGAPRGTGEGEGDVQGGQPPLGDGGGMGDEDRSIKLGLG
jgi:hypothetical protein